MEDVVVLYNDDASAWSDFILNYIGKEKFHLKVSTLCDSNIDDDLGSTPYTKVKVIIVIVSAGHLNFLRNLDRRCGYENLIQKAGTTIILLCGIYEEEETEYEDGAKQWQDRIPCYARCIKFTHEQYHEMLKMIIIKVEDYEDGMLTGETETTSTNESGRPTLRKKPGGVAREMTAKKQSWKFTLIPKTAKVEKSTTMMICFDDDQSWSNREDSEENDKRMTYETENLKDKVTVVFGSSDEILVFAERINRNTFLFHSPEHSAGEVPIKIMMNGDVIGQSSITYQSIESDLMLAISQIYMFLLNRVLGIYEEHGALTQELDQSMSGLFEDEDSGWIPLQAFEQLFAQSKATDADTGKSESDYPTLLHLAARYNLFKFGSKLTDLPDSDAAFALRNRQGLTPGEIARSKGHFKMIKLFEALSGNQTKSTNETDYTSIEYSDANMEEEENLYMTVKEADNYEEQTQLSSVDFRDQTYSGCGDIASGLAAKSPSLVNNGQDELVKTQHQVNKGSKPKVSFVGKLLKITTAQQRSKGSIASPDSPHRSDLWPSFQSPLHSLALNQSEKPLFFTRDSLASNSSRDSCISKTSYVSVIETVDDSEYETCDALQAFAKRKSSANLEQLEDDLRNPNSQRPPPLPPRRINQLERTIPSPLPKFNTTKCPSFNAIEDEPDYLPMNRPPLSGIKTGITADITRQNRATGPETAPKKNRSAGPETAPKTRKMSCPGGTALAQQISMPETENKWRVTGKLTGNSFDQVAGPLTNRELTSVATNARARKMSLPTLYGDREKPTQPLRNV